MGEPSEFIFNSERALLVRIGNWLTITPTIQYGVETYFGEMPRLRVPARKVESFYTLVSECVNPDNQGIS